MRPGAAAALALAILGACASPGVEVAAAGTDAVTVERRAFWREAAAVKGTVPDGRTAAEWARELDPWLASTDPELRDDLAYTILAGWIVRGKIEDEPLRALAAKWRADLGRPGATDADVVARSFAALTLAAVVAFDLQHPFLGDELPRIRAAALDYAAREHDVRGYDEHLGWVHSTAHAADLLKFLARAPDLPVAEQAAFLAVLDAKSDLPRATWTAGEDLRLARVALALVKRDDLDRAAFESWVAGYETAYRGIWTAPRVDGARLAACGNRRRVLAELSALLAGEDGSDRLTWARKRVLDALRETG
ncbi:MAG: DUF2785 domain-containing protein [Planctomycetota bacterium]|nr:DUF2785 domain-containing protein [Planctomycetota bacterium]